MLELVRHQDRSRVAALIMKAIDQVCLLHPVDRARIAMASCGRRAGGGATQPFGDGQGPDASRIVWAFAAKQFLSLCAIALSAGLY